MQNFNLDQWLNNLWLLEDINADESDFGQEELEHSFKGPLWPYEDIDEEEDNKEELT